MQYEDMTEEELASLELLLDSEIDYSELSDTILRKLALRNELFIATTALSTLHERKSSLAVPTSVEILEKSHGDGHLQAVALSTLFDLDRMRAVQYMSRATDTCDLIPLSEFITLAAKTPSIDAHFEMREIVSRIEHRLKARESGSGFLDEDVRADFEKLRSQFR
jgi:hypothetical protein